MSARRLLEDGGSARLTCWVVVVLVAIQSCRMAPSPAWWATAIVPTALFILWDAVCRRRLPQLASVMFGVALIGLGFFTIGRIQDDLNVMLGGAVLTLVLPLQRLLPFVAGVLAASWWMWAGQPVDMPPMLSVAGEVLIVAVIYVLHRLASASQRLRETREDLAEMEVDAERQRLAEELNTVIGGTLQTVARQVSSAQSLIDGRNHPAARAQLDDVQRLVAQGREVLGRLSFEPVVNDLDEELSTAQSLCTRMEVEFTAATSPLPDQDTSRLAGLVLRESITNMFKHASPTRCVLVARQEDGGTLVSVINDGVDDRSPSVAGSGQRHLRAQVEELDGRMEAGPLEGGRYRVLVHLPPRLAGGRSVDVQATAAPQIVRTRA